MESGRITSAAALTLKFNDNRIAITPPRTFLQLKYSLNKILGTRCPPSNLMLIHEKYELDSHTYENIIARIASEVTIIQRECDPNQLIYVTSAYLILHNLPHKNPEKISINQIHWSSVPFSIPNKNLLLITGDKNIEIDSSGLAKEKSPMQFPRYYFASAIVCNFIYILGGVSIEGYTNICERYNINTEQWEYIHSHIGAGKSGMSAIQWGNLKIFLLGGLDGINYSANIEVYDIDVGHWKMLPVTLPWINYYMGVVEMEKGIIIFGGKNNRECVFLDISSLAFKNESLIPLSLECTKFNNQQSKRIGNFIYFLNLEGSVVQFDTLTKKIEIYFDHKKLIQSWYIILIYIIIYFFMNISEDIILLVKIF